jgi:hypothetical protein
MIRQRGPIFWHAAYPSCSALHLSNTVDLCVRIDLSVVYYGVTVVVLQSDVSGVTE